ncbi:MAG: ABC transporter ATP-binding protein, partial [Chlamydiota bacterium]
LLDEPTNDLDIPTLETLEEGLLEFPGAVVLITHDRCMLDRTCNVMLALGDPEETKLYADYSQWEAAQTTRSEPKTAAKKAEGSRRPSLSYLEKKEYEEIEGKILKLEEKVKTLNHLLETPEVAQDAPRLSEVCLEIGL